VLEEKAGEEAGIIPSGHLIVNNRLKAKFNEAGWIAEQIGGINYLFFLRKLTDEIDENWSNVLENLESVRRVLLNQNNALCNVTVEDGDWCELQTPLEELIAALPKKDVDKAVWTPEYNQDHEGLSIPSQVNYVGKGANLYQLGYQLSGSIAVITRYLGTTWLWEKIRVQGGAYGGFSTFDQQSGLFNYLSYRDPNLLKSLENFDNSAQFLKSLDLSNDELVKVIIGAIGGLDTYRLPDAKGYTSMTRHLLGLSDVVLQQYRNEVLATTKNDFISFAHVLENAKDVGQVIVLGSQDAMEAVNQELGAGWLQITKVI
jgi:Zn-dependent M16 (insulinase) family peptidase